MKYTGNDIEKQYKIIPVGRAKDLTGKRFGRLVAVGRTCNKGDRATWLCKCDCGNYTTVIAKHLVGKAIMSCGCLLKELQTPIDLKGKKFGKWKVLELSNKKSIHGDIYWKCKCECGTVKDVMSRNLRKGGSESCGCIRGIDITGQRFGKLTAIKPTKQKDGTNIVWEMKCDCGDTTYVSTANLGDGKRKTKSCGCLHRDVVFKDLKGQRFGRLVVTKEDGYIGDRIAWECLCNCGNTTRVQGGHLQSGGTRSCGCMQIEMVTGENNHNYNPNKTDEERLLKRYVLGKHTIDGFRKAVYKRDEYTCQLCGQVGGSLNAHHLDGWNWAKDKRFDVDNGVTLCEGCHISFHSMYGKGYNTKEQFKEFKHNTKSKEYTEALV